MTNVPSTIVYQSTLTTALSSLQTTSIKYFSFIPINTINIDGTTYFYYNFILDTKKINLDVGPSSGLNPNYIRKFRVITYIRDGYIQDNTGYTGKCHWNDIEVTMTLPVNSVGNPLSSYPAWFIVGALNIVTNMPDNIDLTKNIITKMVLLCKFLTIWIIFYFSH